MAIEEIESKELPSDDWQRPFDAGQPPKERRVSPEETDSRSQRIHKEACRCFFPLRTKSEAFGHWSKESLQAAEHRADVARDLERLAGRWAKLRRSFNDWLDEIYHKKNLDRLERAKGFEFQAKLLSDLEPFDRLLAHFLCRGESVNEMEEVIASSRNFRSIRWNCLQPRPSGTDQAAA